MNAARLAKATHIIISMPDRLDTKLDASGFYSSPCFTPATFDDFTVEQYNQVKKRLASHSDVDPGEAAATNQVSSKMLDTSCLRTGSSGPSEAAQSIWVCRRPLRAIEPSLRVRYHDCSVKTIPLRIWLKFWILPRPGSPYLVNLSIPEEGVQEGEQAHARRSLRRVHRRTETSMWPIHNLFAMLCLRRRADLMSTHQTSHRPNINLCAVSDVGRRREMIEVGLRRPNLQRGDQVLRSLGSEERCRSLVSNDTTRKIVTNLLPGRLS